jgi:uncharacterized protein (TIRG00374 family)
MCRKIISAIAFIFSIGLGGGLIFALLNKVGLTKITVMLEQISWPTLALAVAIYAGSWLFRTWRLACFTTKQVIGTDRLFRIQIAGFAMNAVLPIKLGDALILLGLHLTNISIGRATAIVVQLRILDLFAILIATAPLAFAEIRLGIPEWIKHIVFIFGIIACLPLLFTLLIRFVNLNVFLERRVLKIHYPFLRFFMFKLIDACSAYFETISQGRLFIKTAGLSCMIWLMEGLTTSVIALAMNVEAPLSFILPAMALANLGKAAPVTPGGIGVYESIMALILMLGGVPLEHAIPVAICDHLLKKTFTICLGLPSIPALLGPHWQNNLKSVYVKLKQLKKNETSPNGPYY